MLDKDAGLLPCVNPTLYPTALQHIKLLFCLHYSHCVTKNIKSKRYLCLHDNTVEWFWFEEEL